LKNEHDFRNGYWIVAGSVTEVFSAASGDYVPVADATYQAWVANGNRAGRIANEDELGELLAYHNIVPVRPAVLDAYKGYRTDKLPVDVLLKVLFNHENRIRDLAGQPNVSPAQFRNAIKNLL
jgi:hypothetical protein